MRGDSRGGALYGGQEWQRKQQELAMGGRGSNRSNAGLMAGGGEPREEERR